MTPIFSLGFITDIHARAGKINRRSDDFLQATLRKVDFSIETMRAEPNGYLAIGGDIGHKHIWPSDLVHALKNCLGKWDSRRIFSILGNHDMPGNNFEASRTASGIWLLDNVLQLLEHPKTLVSRSANCALELGPYSYDASETRQLLETTHSFKRDETTGLSYRFKVALVHARIGSVEGYGIRDYRTLTISGEDWDYALFGDVHDGFPIYKLPTGCTVANPGALTRDDIGDVHRTPQMLLLRFFEDGSSTREYIVVPHAPAEEVFNMERAPETKLKSKLVEALRSVSREAATMTPTERAVAVGEKLESLPESVDRVKKALDAKR